MKTDWVLEIRFAREADRAMAAETLPAVLEELGLQGIEEPVAPAGASPGTTFSFLAFFPASVDPAQVLECVRRTASALRDEGLLNSPAQLTTAPVRRHDWVARFRQGFRGVRVPPRVRIVPPWRAAAGAGVGPSDAGIEIQIDPGTAFGTGMHETTRLCLQILQREIRGGERVADLGAGSGILAIAAVRLGARSAWAVEVDPQAHGNLRHNIRLNRAGRRVRVVESGGVEFADDCLLRDRRFDLIVCNMLPERMRPLLARFRDLARRRRPARIVLSGHLCKERPKWLETLRRAGVVVDYERKRNDWGALAGHVEGRGMRGEW